MVAAGDCGGVVACVGERGTDAAVSVGADDGPFALLADAPVVGCFFAGACCVFATAEGVLGAVTAADCGGVAVCVVERGADATGPVDANDFRFAVLVDALVAGCFFAGARLALPTAVGVLGVVAAVDVGPWSASISGPGTDAITDTCK